MRNENLVIGTFTVMMIFAFGLQFLIIENFSNWFFNHEIKRQLVSSVQIKGEIIEDYFLENLQDVKFLSTDKEIENIFSKGLRYNPTIEENTKKQTDKISKKIDIFKERNPDISDEELIKNKEILEIANLKIGENSKIFLNPEGQVDYILNQNDFLSAEPSLNLEEFVELGEYRDLILVNENGFVIYSSGPELGINIKFLNEDIIKIYEKTSETGELIYGPYIHERNDGFEMVLAFSHLRKNGEMVILLDKMNFLNNILENENSFGDLSKIYLVDKNNFLVSDLNNEVFGEMVQKISNNNTEKCFKNKKGELDFEELTTSSYGLLGENVIGTYSYLEKPGMCLIAEIQNENILKLSKSKFLKDGILLTGILNLFLITMGIFFLRRQFR